MFKVFGKKIRVRVAALIVENDNILLIAHKKNNKVYWLLPGGGVEYTESLDKALIRELKEELDIEVKVNDIVMVVDSIEPEGKRHIINIIFECNLINSSNINLANEKRLYDYKFMKIDKLGDVKLYPPINQLLIDYLNGKNKVLYKGSLWIED